MRVQTDKTKLHEKCVEYEDNTNCIAKIRQYLIKNKDKAVGIAANQLFMKNRVFGMWYKGKIMIFENPKIISYMSELMQDSTEGCMSIKGGNKAYHLKRPRYLVVNDGKINHMFQGYIATVVCHEMDHLDGFLVCDKERNDYNQLYKEAN